MAVRRWVGSCLVVSAVVGWGLDARTSERNASAPSAPLLHEWRLVAGRSWQIASPAGEDPEVTDAAEGNRGHCPTGMVDVRGNMKVSLAIDDLQKTACTKWIDKDHSKRCAEYDRDKWLKVSGAIPTREMHFCIDRFEYPNRKGEYPLVLVNYYEGGLMCGAQKKRLCSEDEWTFACEGEEAQPYPNGYTRDTDACVVDHEARRYDSAALTFRTEEKAMRELDRLWQGEPSGRRPACKSPFGVYDMTGNVDEWTKSTHPTGRPSILKGGYWGPVRTRCRPATRAHGEAFVFYQQGLRCCADPGT
jgi:hypothetical protein